MKKIKYGNRDKTKQKKNPFIQALKQDDDVCGAVLDSFSNDYLSYISGLVKGSKTPSKMRTQQRIDALFQNKKQEPTKQLKQTPLNLVKNKQSKQVSPKSPKSYEDHKNSTVPIKNLRQLGEPNETGYIKKQRQKSLGAVYQQNKLSNAGKIDRRFNLKIKQHYNRFPTQQAQNPIKSPKFDHTSIVCSDESGRNKPYRQQSKKIQSGRQFLEGIDEYVVTLQKNKNFKKQQPKIHSGKLKNNEDIKTIQQLYQQNVKLRKKLRKYEQKMVEVEQNMENHFIHCKKQQKIQKLKINDLTKALLRAIAKVNQQKQQIQEMKDELRNFGRKAQFCVNKYEADSSDGEEEIHESILKVMRPSRATSQYKMKRKKTDLMNYALFDKD